MKSTVPRLRGAVAQMRALDELPWAAGISATSFGVRIGVRVDDEGFLPLIRERLPPGSVPLRREIVSHLCSVRTGGGANGRPFYRVNADADLLASTADQDAALAAVETALRRAVAANADHWVFVHAGAVAWNGRAILIPAPTFRGKSTLVEALVRAGATYYSDEFAVLDPRGRVHAFAKPLSIRTDDGPPRRMTATDLGGVVGDEPLPIGLVFSTQYTPDAPWQPRVASQGEAVFALLANTVRARSAPEYTLKVLTRAVAGCVMLEAPRGEAGDVAPALLQALDRGVPEALPA